MITIKTARVVAILAGFIMANAWGSDESIHMGRTLVEKKGCVACHGADFNSPIDPSYPKLAGQHEDYLLHSLIAYQRGAKGPNGRVNAIMNAQVASLTQQEMAAIAAYLHSLPGSLVLRK